MHNPIQIWCADSFAGIDLQLVVDIGLYNTTLTSRGFSALCFLPSVAGVAECDLIIKFYFLDFNVYIIYLDLWVHRLYVTLFVWSDDLLINSTAHLQLHEERYGPLFRYARIPNKPSHQFLADRMLQCCVCRLSSVRNILWLNGSPYSYYWQPIGSRIWGIDWYQNEWPWLLFRGRIKVMRTIASLSPMNISETVRNKGLVPKDHQ